MGSRSRVLCVLVVLLCVVLPGQASAAKYDALYKDPSQPVEARVQDLLKRLTLDEKLDTDREDCRQRICDRAVRHR
jgi:hypothetical protein